MGGMNRAGLVVGLMLLDGTVYPAPADRATAGNLQSIQYRVPGFGIFGSSSGESRSVNFPSSQSPAPLKILLVVLRVCRCDDGVMVAMSRHTALKVGFAVPPILLFSFAFHTLLRTPCLGVADIYDFWRVMRPAGIEHIEALVKPGRFVVCTFKTGKAHLASGPSSATLVAWCAKHLSWGLKPGRGLMDLRQMGRLCLSLVALVFLAGLAARASPILLTLLLYVLVDPGFLLFFNSFYAEATFYIALFGLAVWLERYGDVATWFWEPCGRRWTAVAAGLICLLVLGGASKMQYVLFPALATACICTQLVVNGRRPTVRTVSVAGALVLVSVAAPTLFFVGPAPRFPEANNYHAVFGGITRVASDPEKALRDLGVPRQYWRLPQTDMWSANVAKSHPVHRHLKNLSRRRLLFLYAGDPGAVIKIMAKIEDELATVETDPRGHSVLDARHQGKTTFGVWWQWSRIHAAVYGAWPPIVWAILFFGAGWGGFAVLRNRLDGAKVATLFLALWVPSQLVVIVLGEGLVNLKAHLVGTRLALDFLVVMVGWDVTRTLVGRRIPARATPAAEKKIRGPSRSGFEQVPGSHRCRNSIDSTAE